MKILKFTGIVLGALVVLFFLIALFLPNQSRVERSITINKSAKEVYRVLIDFKLYEHWNPFLKMEPKAKHAFSTPSNQVGSSWEWDGEKTGKGKITHSRIVENSEIEERLDFFAPMKGDAKAIYFLEPGENGGTKVRWVYEGEASYPSGRYMALMMDSMLGPAFELGLKDLKAILEN